MRVRHEKTLASFHGSKLLQEFFFLVCDCMELKRLEEAFLFRVHGREHFHAGLKTFHVIEPDEDACKKLYRVDPPVIEPIGVEKNGVV